MWELAIPPMKIVIWGMAYGIVVPTLLQFKVVIFHIELSFTADASAKVGESARRYLLDSQALTTGRRWGKPQL
jgi:hypothetical protein